MALLDLGCAPPTPRPFEALEPTPRRLLSRKLGTHQCRRGGSDTAAHIRPHAAGRLLTPGAARSGGPPF
jgi:hypothetical protein